MELSKLEKEVLLQLAEKGPLCGYDFHLGGERERAGRKATMSTSSWFKVRDSLVATGLIKRKTFKGRKGSISVRAGRKKNLYWLTEDGAGVALTLGASPDVLRRHMEHFENSSNVELLVQLAEVLGLERMTAMHTVISSRHPWKAMILIAAENAILDPDTQSKVTEIIRQHPRMGPIMNGALKLVRSLLKD